MNANGSKSLSRLPTSGSDSVDQVQAFSSLPRHASQFSNNHSTASELSSPSTASVGFPLHRSVSVYDNVDLEESYQAALKQSPLSSRMNSPDSEYVFVPYENNLKTDFITKNGNL